MTDVQDEIASSQVKIDETFQRFADGFSYLRRSPILHTPAEFGLEFEDVSFPALEGVPLGAWYIPAAGSSNVIIANHPMGFSRSGIPTHLQPWHADWAPSGNGFEVNLVPDYKILHHAGYNVLAYHLRKHGMSSAANGGVCMSGVTEARDVVGSIEYVRSRPDTQGHDHRAVQPLHGGQFHLPSDAALSGSLRRHPLPRLTAARHDPADRRAPTRGHGPRRPPRFVMNTQRELRQAFEDLERKFPEVCRVRPRMI